MLNDVTIRPEIWRRFDGDDWAAFDALPAVIRHRLHEHAYDAWSVNALILWRRLRRQHASSDRAAISLLRYLDQLEVMERAAFAQRYADRHGAPLPHQAAGATVARYRNPVPAQASTSAPSNVISTGLSPATM